jgi:hypothetical protein
MSNKLDVFKNEPDDKQSLYDNTVFMIRDGDQNIWIGTSGGLHTFIESSEEQKAVSRMFGCFFVVL